MKTLLNAVLVLAAIAGATHAHAQQGHLNVTTIVQKEEVVVDENGQQSTRLVAAAKVVPGDQVVYTVTFANVSDEAADNIVITNPLPAEMTYVEGSAFGPGAEIEFSADGGKSFAAREKLTVPDEQGGQRQARAEDYTHIRWVMREQVRAGSQGVAQFRARLN
ncbi:MAG: hypothetical protein OEW35_00405 [Gammaproteobacteria bacterium]|nr:hypothetical protein [Gammaproteobacteria bacterium]MDH4252963.1 hypothetical protein [Gammaproteobacteria bacterium]MDH5308351.1 hypothetical protein [Gammaproteobacteria bacterium]